MATRRGKARRRSDWVYCTPSVAKVVPKRANRKTSCVRVSILPILFWPPSRPDLLIPIGHHGNVARRSTSIGLSLRERRRPTRNWSAGATMANPEHTEIAKQGAGAIWAWREKNPEAMRGPSRSLPRLLPSLSHGLSRRIPHTTAEIGWVVDAGSGARRPPRIPSRELAIPGTGIACDQGRCIFGNNRCVWLTNVPQNAV